MSLRHGALLLMVLPALIAGCKLDRTAEDIAQMRMSGSVSMARDRAIDELKENSKQMDVWRELAITDVQLGRRAASAVEAQEDPLPYLVEAALICGAYNEYKKGLLDREWNGAGVSSAAETSNWANHLVSRLPIDNFGRVPYDPPGYLPRDLEDPDDQPLTVRPQGSNPDVFETYVDPETAGEIIQQTAMLMELFRHLPCDNPKVAAVNLNQIEQKLLWAASHSNLSAAFVDLQRDKGRKAAAVAFDAARNDLAEHHHFDARTLLSNRLAE
ncbi:MAG TPA: hypothetical protein VGL38_00215 [bacterium]|jgi:hypothetical protein